MDTFNKLPKTACVYNKRKELIAKFCVLFAGTSFWYTIAQLAKQYFPNNTVLESRHLPFLPFCQEGDASTNKQNLMNNLPKGKNKNNICFILYIK